MALSTCGCFDPLRETDPEIHALIAAEERRQAQVLRMIPSENYASSAVLAASGSVLTNKYSEGYAHRRYYQGQGVIDQMEDLAVARATRLFGAEHANLQPYSGSPANLAVYVAILKPGGSAMGMELASGGHLTHGAKVSVTGKFFNVRQYGLDPQTELIDYAAVRRLARECRPGLIFAGCTAYPRRVDFAAFAEIAREVGAKLVADISHISGLCLTGQHPHPFPHADVVTTTTHKLLRGPRGGMILCKKELAAAIDKAVFPGLQGGPHNHTTAAIAVALKEAATPAYAAYCARVVEDARALAEGLLAEGFRLVTGGTDNHLVLVDLSPLGLAGKPFAQALEAAGVVGNYNKIPGDPRPADDPSGLRLGTPALASRGMGHSEMARVAKFIGRVARDQDPANLARIKAEVVEFCAGFPAPGLPAGV